MAGDVRVPKQVDKFTHPGNIALMHPAQLTWLHWGSQQECVWRPICVSVSLPAMGIGIRNILIGRSPASNQPQQYQRVLQCMTEVGSEKELRLNVLLDQASAQQHRALRTRQDNKKKSQSVGYVPRYPIKSVHQIQIQIMEG